MKNLFIIFLLAFSSLSFADLGKNESRIIDHKNCEIFVAYGSHTHQHYKNPISYDEKIEIESQLLENNWKVIDVSQSSHHKENSQEFNDFLNEMITEEGSLLMHFFKPDMWQYHLKAELGEITVRNNKSMLMPVLNIEGFQKSCCSVREYRRDERKFMNQIKEQLPICNNKLLDS